MTRLALTATSNRSFEETVSACRQALASEGFGVLTEIDLAATLKAKLDVDRDPYLILGACHPSSAKALVETMPAFGVLLPCNVTVSTEDGTTIVRAMDPAGVVDAVLGIGDRGDRRADTVREIAADIGHRLERAMAKATDLD